MTDFKRVDYTPEPPRKHEAIYSFIRYLQGEIAVSEKKISKEKEHIKYLEKHLKDYKKELSVANKWSENHG